MVSSLQMMYDKLAVFLTNEASHSPLYKSTTVPSSGTLMEFHNRKLMFQWMKWITTNSYILILSIFILNDIPSCLVKCSKNSV